MSKLAGTTYLVRDIVDAHTRLMGQTLTYPKGDNLTWVLFFVTPTFARQGSLRLELAILVTTSITHTVPYPGFFADDVSLLLQRT